MKPSFRFLPLLAASLLAVSCSSFLDLLTSDSAVKASANVVVETRPISGITTIDMSAIGRVLISQGEPESLTVRGADNLLPMIHVTVANDMLIIEMEKNFAVSGLNDSNTPTFTVVVKDLTDIRVSGAGVMELDGLSASRLRVTLNSGNKMALRNLALDDLRLDLLGIGGVLLTGTADTAKILFSGAGDLDAADLEIQTADIDFSGPGNAKLWVTELLTGVITGNAGNIEYYGEPEIKVRGSGSDKLKPLGSK
jgi:hypothetical protein